jgi:iron complex outermembrane recepter protein
MKFTYLKESFVIISTFFIFSNLTFAQGQIFDLTFGDTLYVYAEKDAKIAQYNSITTKSSIPLFRTPFRVGVITSAIIQSQNGITLSDALNHVSGVNPQAGLGIYDYFIIRGFNSLDNSLVLYDDIIEPEATIYNLYNIDRVEVLKGPGAFLYGGSPLSGTINLVRKQPVFRNFASFSGSAGSFQTYRGNVDAGFAKPEIGFASRINGIWQQSDLYRKDKYNEVYAINPAFTWQINNSSQLNVNVEYFGSKTNPDAGLPLMYDFSTRMLNKIADVPRDLSYQTPFDESDQRLIRTQLKFIKKINSNLSIKNNFYFTDLDWFSRGTILNGAFPGGAAINSPYFVNRSLQRLDYRQKFFGNQLEVHYSLGSSNFGHKIVTGLEINRLNDLFAIDIIPQIPAINLKNPVETVGNVIQFYPYQSGDAKNTVIAPYILDVISLGQKVNLFLGSRYDYISFIDELDNTNEEFKKLSPMLGFNYTALSSLALFGNIGKSFAPPSSRVVGNLEAEESNQIEMGLKKNWLDGKIRTTVSVYQLKKDNIAIPDRNGISKQIGSQESQGIEIEFSGQMTEKCASLFSYSYTDATLTEFSEVVNIGFDGSGSPILMYYDHSNNTSAFAPKHIVNFWHTREIGEHFGYGAGFRYVSDQFIFEDNIFKIYDYFTIDANLFYKLGKMRWFLNLKNITDTKYEMRGFGAASVIPAPPFAIYGGFEISY